MRHVITLELEQDQIDFLAALGVPLQTDGERPSAPRVRAAAAVWHLVRSAIDGVRRPGAWERTWLVQAFGEQWTSNLEKDPRSPWYHRPRRTNTETP
jgi:hypothetical protein